MKCICCGEEYDKNDIRELKMMHENFWYDGKCLICPDCLDDLQHMAPEEMVESFIN